MGAAVSQNKHSVNNTVIPWNNTLIIKLISAQTIASYLWFAVGSCTSVAGKQGRCGALGRRIRAPRFARGRWRRCWAGNQLRASGRCAGFRDVVSYSCLAWKLLLLGADWSGSQGAAGWFVWCSGLGWIRIKEDSFLLLVANLPFCRDKTTTGKQLRVVQVKQSVSSAGERKTVPRSCKNKSP